jgi:hypothetical protein
VTVKKKKPKMKRKKRKRKERCLPTLLPAICQIGMGDMEEGISCRPTNACPQKQRSQIFLSRPQTISASSLNHNHKPPPPSLILLSSLPFFLAIPLILPAIFFPSPSCASDCLTSLVGPSSSIRREKSPRSIQPPPLPRLCLLRLLALIFSPSLALALLLSFCFCTAGRFGLGRFLLIPYSLSCFSSVLVLHHCCAPAATAACS